MAKKITGDTDITTLDPLMSEDESSATNNDSDILLDPLKSGSSNTGDGDIINGDILNGGSGDNLNGSSGDNLSESSGSSSETTTTTTALNGVSIGHMPTSECLIGLGEEKVRVIAKDNGDGTLTFHISLDNFIGDLRGIFLDFLDGKFIEGLQVVSGSFR